MAWLSIPCPRTAPSGPCIHHSAIGRPPWSAAPRSPLGRPSGAPQTRPGQVCRVVVATGDSGNAMVKAPDPSADVCPGQWGTIRLRGTRLHTQTAAMTASALCRLHHREYLGGRNSARRRPGHQTISVGLLGPATTHRHDPLAWHLLQVLSEGMELRRWRCWRRGLASPHLATEIYRFGPISLNRWITPRTASSSPWTNRAIAGTVLPPAEAGTTIARRSRTAEPVPLRTTCCSR